MSFILNLYFILSFGVVISSSFVIFLTNPIYSLLWLVVTFLFAACLLLILGQEFLGLIFIVIYVGAIAVLFLFLVMLLDLKFKNLQNKKNNLVFIVICYSIIFLLFLLVLNFNNIKLEFFIYNLSTIFKKCSFELKFLFICFLFFTNKFNFMFINWVEFINSLNEIDLYGFVLYDIFVLQFLLIGFILLSVLIGVVFLTNSYKSFKTTDQSVFKQISVNSHFFYK